MKGRICLVTGASSGIGKVTAEDLARLGATVVMVCRDRQRGESAVAEVRQATGNPDVQLMLADFSSQQSIRELAAAVHQRFDRLHVLVNNAGAMFATREVTVDGIEATLAVNHLGYFLLTNLLLDLLKAGAPSRVVNVASESQSTASIDFHDLQGERKYGSVSAYSQSKLANVLFTVELARRLEGTGITVNCLHPGVVRTKLASVTPFLRLAMMLVRPFAATPQAGARTSVYLATSKEVEGVTGRYFIGKRVVEPSPHARNPEIAERLWEVSERLVSGSSTVRTRQSIPAEALAEAPLEPAA